MSTLLNPPTRIVTRERPASEEHAPQIVDLASSPAIDERSSNTSMSWHIAAWNAGESVPAADVARWRSLMDESADAPVELHPDLLLVDSQGLVGPKRIDVIRATTADDQVVRLAVLEEKAIRLPFFPRLPKLPALRGVRLVGRQIVGGEPQESYKSFVSRLSGYLASSSPARDAILIEDLETVHPLWRALVANSDLRVLALGAPQPRWRLKLAESAESYWSSFSSKRRYNFRRMQRLLPHTWKVVESVAEVEGFLEDAVAISEQSWQGKRLGTRIRKDAATIRQFTRLAELGALRCYLMYSEGTPAAFAIGTQWQGCYQLEEIGFDPRFADLSPGTVLMLEMLDDLHARRKADCLDFGFGDGAYKRQFGNQETASGSLLVVSRRARPSALALLHGMGRRLESTARLLAEHAGIKPLLRRLYRRGNPLVDRDGGKRSEKC